GKDSLCCASQYSQLLHKRRVTILRKRRQKIVQQCPQPPGNLDALSPVLANLGKTQMDEIAPIRRVKSEPVLAAGINKESVIQMPARDKTQKMMNLIQCQHRCRRVVNGRRQRLARNIDDDPQCEGRILLVSALRTDCDRVIKLAIGQRCAAMEDAK